MTHGICKLISLKLKMSIFFFGIIYVIVGWGKKTQRWQLWFVSPEINCLNRDLWIVVWGLSLLKFKFRIAFPNAHVGFTFTVLGVCYLWNITFSKVTFIGTYTYYTEGQKKNEMSNLRTDSGQMPSVKTSWWFHKNMNLWLMLGICCICIRALSLLVPSFPLINKFAKDWKIFYKGLWTFYEIKWANKVLLFL